MFSSQTKNNPNKNNDEDCTETFTRQGSLRRVLPPTQDSDRENNLFGRQNEDLNKIYKIYRQEYIILAEYKMIQSEDIQGVYVIPSRENPLVWFGVIFVRNGPYKDGIFRFSVILDDNFPDCEHPKVIFQSKIFHPVIDSGTNELNLKSAFPTWHKNEQHIWQVLKFIQWIFANFESSLTHHSINEEAKEMFTNNKDKFISKAQEIVQQIKDTVHEVPPTDDKHFIFFDQFNPEIHKKEKMIAYIQQKDNNKKSGYSWVLKGNYKPLERPATPPEDYDNNNESKKEI